MSRSLRSRDDFIIQSHWLQRAQIALHTPQRLYYSKASHADEQNKIKRHNELDFFYIFLPPVYEIILLFSQHISSFPPQKIITTRSFLELFWRCKSYKIFISRVVVELQLCKFSFSPLEYNLNQRCVHGGKKCIIKHNKFYLSWVESIRTIRFYH